jgi:hypothetical protein
MLVGNTELRMHYDISSLGMQHFLLVKIHLSTLLTLIKHLNTLPCFIHSLHGAESFFKS